MSQEQRKAFDLFSFIDTAQNDEYNYKFNDDIDDDSKIKIKDVVPALLSMGIQVDKSVVNQQLKLLDIEVKRNTTLNFQEFSLLCNQFKDYKINIDEECDYVFNLIDKNGDGLISLDDLKFICQQYPEFHHIQLDQLKKIIQVAISDHYGDDANPSDVVDKNCFKSLYFKLFG